MIEVSELKGFKSLRALNVFNTLVIGLKMLPSYQKYDFEELLLAMNDMDEADQRKCLKEAALLVELEKSEVESLISFCKDANGVPYTAQNLKSLKPNEIVEMIVAVCMEISKFKIDLISDDEKKNLKTGQLIQE